MDKSGHGKRGGVMSHTPGPWGYGHEIHLVSNGGIYDGQAMVSEVYDGAIFAGTGEDWEQIATGITSEDNARLIASAPDMKDEIDRLKAEKADLLEALEEIASVIDESEGVAGWHLNGAVAPWSEFGFAQKIEDVIEKARREEWTA